ncbi:MULTISPECIES: uroporphyrinogen-III C-methyltransferase [unclassified Tatumella]|uniref:uroporphyrinogen-III C-methyltransferase n=1 Tax=unclassified Tatumella TaxID=2649542 RepID=UPI001BAEF539|nr:MULTISPECIES: uroporphyrinogen-III C-methyltransferase [unclassified Tatumella]MBS0876536.1 uroporphyrinogen-III C-methyltransferase [Tatumella sp. JGM82]MBS0890077.1 uroporphyrinogen-III C-methyltransferase [Tatumella sp. JGM94]MBS0901321.1 uroporphyrinogen-III C-methyltransferase [Tatumella sp. JGM100]
MINTNLYLPLAPSGQPVIPGEVWLVGAGPGDAELLTLKALRVIRQADVVVHDRLVSADIMALVPATVRCIDVGKSRGNHRLSQPQINQLLGELACAGQRVIRLKGGDPFIFGRGGEELEALQQAGIPCHIIPGITAATGCAAAVGLPLTHRDCAQSLRLITAHTRCGDELCEDISLASSGQTLVFYMGLGHSIALCQRLMALGLAGDMPLAIIEKGTLPEQRLLIGTVQTLPALLARYQPQPPGVLIVGKVVAYCRAPALRVTSPELDSNVVNHVAA